MLTIDLDYRTFQLDEKEGVTAQIKPLDTKTYNEILSFLTSEGFTGEDSNNTEKMLKMMTSPKYSKLVSTVLIGNCKEVAGAELKVDGKVRAITVEDITTKSILSNWATALFFGVFSASSLQPEEVETVKK